MHVEGRGEDVGQQGSPFSLAQLQIKYIDIQNVPLLEE